VGFTGGYCELGRMRVVSVLNLRQQVMNLIMGSMFDLVEEKFI